MARGYCRRCGGLAATAALAVLTAVVAAPGVLAAGVRGPATASAAETVTVLCGALFDPRTGAALSNQAITIVDGVVANVTSYATVEEATTRAADGTADAVVDLSDKFVLPGLIDAHTHLFLRPYNVVDWRVQVTQESVPQRTLRAAMYAKMTLQAGFTTVRDLGTEGAMDADLDLKRAIEEGWVEGPRLLIASRAIVSTGGYEPKGFNDHNYVGAETADGPEQMRQVVRRQLNYGGADWIKVYGDYSRYQGRYAPLFTTEEIRMAVEEAAEVGARVAVHAKYPTAIMRAVEAGAASIEHGEHVDDLTLIAMRDAGVAFVPTLSIYEAMTLYEPENEERQKAFERVQYAVFLAKKFGTTVVLGSDVGGVENGQNVREIELLVQSGLTPAEALAAGTLKAGELVSTRLKLGLLEPGYLADVVALDGDPLVDLSALRRVRFVMKEGRVFRDDEGAVTEPRLMGARQAH